MTKYSVLLSYPDYVTGGELQTYLAWVEAKDVPSAVAEAQAEAASDPDIAAEPVDFLPLLVTRGHIEDLFYHAPGTHFVP